MSDETYKVSIKGPGLALERQVPKTISDQLVVLLLTGNPSRVITSPAGTPAGAGNRHVTTASPGDTGKGVEQDLSIREYLDSTNAKRVPDKITAIGAYLAQGGRADFTKADLVSSFEAASESVPKNLGRDLRWTSKAAWIAARTGKKDTWYVTKSGHEAIKAKFSPEVVKRTRGLTPTGKTRKKKENAD
jgi:hypothetical protein